MKEFFKQLQSDNKRIVKGFPKKTLVHRFLKQMSYFLFPILCEGVIDCNTIEEEWEDQKQILRKLLLPLEQDLESNINDIVDVYFERIPEIYNQLVKDAEAINDFDPASYSMEEVILAYPGFNAILSYRLAHELYNLKVPIIPRLMSECAHSKTGIDINPGAKIGNSFFIDHGTGIVIGETTVIGNNVKIYQGVTLGALNVKKEEAKTKRHPTIEDNVIVYSGTTILGGKTRIGHDSVVGGNVWLTQSLEPYSLVYNKSEIKVREAKLKEPVNFII